MGLEREWRDEEWEDYYTLNYGNKRIIDAADLKKEEEERIQQLSDTLPTIIEEN